MTDAPTAYPLQWPPGWPETLPEKRERWPSQVTLHAALNDLSTELRRLGVRNVVLSSNCSLGMENCPQAPGVCAYGLYGDEQIAIPCDRWNTVAANVRAIAKTIEAMRGMERWGAKHMIRAMFQGFRALAAPERVDWRAVLGFRSDERPSRDDVQRRRRELAAIHHPDAGGDAARMAEINAAADAALREIGNA